MTQTNRSDESCFFDTPCVFIFIQSELVAIFRRKDWHEMCECPGKKLWIADGGRGRTGHTLETCVDGIVEEPWKCLRERIDEAFD